MQSDDINKINSEWKVIDLDVHLFKHNVFFVFFNKPIVNIGFDGYSKKLFYLSARRYYERDHYKPLVDAQGVKVAYSESELQSLLNFYLKNPQADSDGRRKIVDRECGDIDGKAGERIAGFILEHLK